MDISSSYLKGLWTAVSNSGLLFLFQIQKANPGIWSAPERRRKNFAERQTVSSTRLCARGEAETDRGVCGWPGPPGPSAPSHSVGAHPTINKITLHTLPWGIYYFKMLAWANFQVFYMYVHSQTIAKPSDEQKEKHSWTVAEQRTLWKYLCFSLCGMTDIHTQI